MFPSVGLILQAAAINMDVLRKNSDYAIRAMVKLSRNLDAGPVSARRLSEEEKISYQLTCKIMQRLERAGLVRSTMGPSGGYELGRKTREIRLSEIISLFQGPVTLKECVRKETACGRSGECGLRERLVRLQEDLDRFLSRVTLRDLL